MSASVAPRIRSLICTSPLAFSSPPWMTAQGEPRLSAYLICVPNLLRIAEIKLGADAGVAQRRDHLLVVGDAVAIEHGDDHRAGCGLCRRACRAGVQRRLQARHADGEAGRRHRLAAEARHQSVVAPAAADRAEAHRAAFLVLGFEQAVQLRRPGRCSIRGRGRRMGRLRIRRVVITSGCATSLMIAKFIYVQLAPTRLPSTDCLEVCQS